MSGQNGSNGGPPVGGIGGPPPGALVLTSALLEQSSRKWVKLPSLSRRVTLMPRADLVTRGLLPDEATPEQEQTLRDTGVWVQIGVVGALEALTMAPVIAEAESWPNTPGERAKAFNAWRDGLTDAARKEYDDKLVAGQRRFISAGLVTPKLPEEACGLFQDDAWFLTTEIQVLSGMIEAPQSPEEPKPAPEPVPEPVPAEAAAPPQA